MPKVGGRKLEKACKNLQNRALALPKSIPKRSKTVFTRKIVFRTALGEQRHSFWKHFFRILGRLRLQDGAKLEIKMESKSIKNDAKNDAILKASWKPKNSEKSSISGAKMEPSWEENRTKNRCRLGKPIFEKSCSRCSGSSIL